jgi:hypothetical protein
VSSSHTPTNPLLENSSVSPGVFEAQATVAGGEEAEGPRE